MSRSFYIFAIVLKIMMIASTFATREYPVVSPFGTWALYGFETIIIIAWIYVLFRYFNYKGLLFSFFFGVVHNGIGMIRYYQDCTSFLYGDYYRNSHLLEIMQTIFVVVYCITILLASLKGMIYLKMLAWSGLILTIGWEIYGESQGLMRTLLSYDFVVYSGLWILVFYNEMKPKERDDILDSELK